MKQLLATLVFVFFGFSVRAQVVLKVNKNEILVDTSSGTKFQKGDQVDFLDAELKIVGHGEVSRVSSSGQKALILLTSGTAAVGMSLDLPDHRPDPNVQSEVHSPAAPHPVLSERDQRILDRGEITTPQYVIGGIVGTPIGLGIGHAIQGRYSERGWIFTVGELASVAALSIGLANCIGDSISGSNCGSADMLFIGYFGLIGFRIWEIIDLWAVPPEENRRYRELTHRTSEVHWQPVLIPLANNRTQQTDGALLGFRLSF